MSTDTKSTTQFTPGPWEVGNTDEVYAGTRIIASTYSSGDYMPHPEAFINGKSVTLVKTKEGRANARLIAAAPELLEALEGAREELRLIRMKDTAAVYDPTIRVRIDAAIAKAVSA